MLEAISGYEKESKGGAAKYLRQLVWGEVGRKAVWWAGSKRCTFQRAEEEKEEGGNGRRTEVLGP
ncbi:hypothetical protein PM082_021224 [Marasmius tenuissimus]|nr:hypothetical protein PM082_021224 [Marasmius tenuissimus]